MHLEDQNKSLFQFDFETQKFFAEYLLKEVVEKSFDKKFLILNSATDQFFH